MMITNMIGNDLGNLMSDDLGHLMGDNDIYDLIHVDEDVLLIYNLFIC